MARPQPSLPFAAVLAWLTAAAPPLSAGTELPDHLALALPVTGITVDGDLSDWPRDLPALPIRNEFGAYGATDTEGTDLGTSADLSPSFRVGYDPGRQLLHVAVEVRDDMLHATGLTHRTDACEIYVSALQEEERPTIQYALVPGDETYPSFDRRGVHRNLRSDRRSLGAWQRRGDLTTYEWSLQVRSSEPIYPRSGPSVMHPLPSRPVRLEGGMAIGFDVVVVDGDGLPTDFRGPRPSPLHGVSMASWVPWGPPVTLKMMRDGRVGRLVLAPEDWSAGFDAGAMAAYLDRWLRDHPEQWISAIERAAGRPHSSGLDRMLDQTAGAGAVLEPEAPGPFGLHYEEVPYRIGPAAGQEGNWLMVLGVGLLGLTVGGVAVYLARRLSASGSSGFGDRLAALESRVTETQEVMIALSEKLDRIDAGDREGSRALAP